MGRPPFAGLGRPQPFAEEGRYPVRIAAFFGKWSREAGSAQAEPSGGAGGNHPGGYGR